MDLVPLVVILSREGSPAARESQASCRRKPQKCTRRTQFRLVHSEAGFRAEEFTFGTVLPAKIPSYIDTAQVARAQRVGIT